MAIYGSWFKVKGQLMVQDTWQFMVHGHEMVHGSRLRVNDIFTETSKRYL